MNRVLLFVILFSAALSLACTPRGFSLENNLAQQAITQEKKAPTLELWETNWNEALAGGRKEGKVIIYSTAGGETRNALVKGFKERIGLEIEITTAKGAEVSEKLLSERRAGLYIADLYVGGAHTLVNQIKPAGVLELLEPWLLLPEVLDENKWWGGKLGWIDQEKQILSFLAYPSGDIAINTNLVKEGEIVSLQDLLNPKWKNKLILNDPTVSGTGLKMFTIMYKKMGSEYIQELVKQNPNIIRDQRQQIEWLAKGKYAIAPSPKSDIMAEFGRAGAPVKSVFPKEGGYLSSGGGQVVIFKGAPHPNAAKIFTNWLLSREGQLIFSKAQLTQSRRIDIDSSHIGPEERRKGQVLYSDVDSESDILEMPRNAALAAEFFKVLMR